MPQEASAMQLLVSVANPADAAAALAGGADVIDAKDPTTGALGPVTPAMLREIHAAVAGTRPVTAAAGDAADEGETERSARDLVAAGAILVKVGFAGVERPERVAALIAAAVRGADGRGIIAVAYADAERVGSVDPAVLVDLAMRGGARGFLIDTADKSGPGICELYTLERLTEVIAEVHAAGLVVALAGKLTAADLPRVRDAGADIAGVRGAACAGGRAGRVSAMKVRALREVCGSHIGTSGSPLPAGMRSVGALEQR
jgi:uncharacterized protein (UPF0264 family)